MVHSINSDQQTKQFSTESKAKFTINDWHLSNHLQLQCSEAQQELARQIIAKSNKVCERTTELVRCNKDQTNHSLKERINEIEFCKEELICNRNELPLEIDALSMYRDRLLDSLSSLRKNTLEICLECLSAREKRIGIDLVNDNVEKELRQEIQSIKCADNLLSQTLEQAQEQLRRLKATLYHIDRDLEEKENSFRIDRYNSTLKETSLNLSIYQGKSTLNPSTITIEEWQLITKKNIDTSNQEIQTGKKVRARVDHVLKQIIDDLISQKKRTDEAFRLRIKETKTTKEKMELQHSEIVRQVNEMSKNIIRLEKTIAEKEGFIALAHTRLGNRCQRPGLELACDQVEISLTNEVSELRLAVAQLQQTLFEAQASFRFLLKMQIQLEEDINIKTNTLKIDEVHCMTMRQSIDYHVF